MFQVAASSDQYDVAVVITDGNPTFYANEQGPGDMTRFIEMENSVFSANAIKNKNTRVIAVGVGDGIDGNPANLKAISGTVKFEENVTPPETADFFQTTDFEEAGKALKALAESSCQGSINVFKKVLPWNGTGLNGATDGGAGWVYTAAKANGSDPVQVTGSPATTNATSGTSVSVTFDNASINSAPINLAEVLQASQQGYSLVQQGPNNLNATCVKSGTSETVPVTNNGALGWTVNALRLGSITCTVYNRQPPPTGQLKLVKDVTNNDGGSKVPNDWTLKAEASGTNPNGARNFQNAGGSGTFKDVFAGQQYTLSESTVPGYSSNGVWVCTGGGTKTGDDKITVGLGEQVTCTITNTDNTPTLKLVKQVSGANADNWILTAKGTPSDRNISTPGGSGDFEDVYAGTQYTLGETGPGGYSPSDWACVSTPGEGQPGVQVLNNGDKITLGLGDRVTCTIINTRDLGSLTITKSFNPKSSGYDKAFTIGYQCADEAKQTVALKAGESTTITGIPTGTECTVSEAKPTDPPAGWSFSQPVYDPADGKVTVTRKDQNVSVTVTNEILKPGINIVKTGSATQVNPGQTVTYTYTVTNPGDAELTDVKVSDDKCAPVTYTSGDSNADSKLQPGETWIYTCSQPITLATTNIGTATGKDKNGQEVSAQDTFTVAVVSPVVVKQICPIEPKLTTPKVKKVGNRVLVKKITTKKSSCVLLKPVVLCRPVAAAAAGQTAFCRTTVTRKGFIRVNTKGYDKVRVTVLVRSKPKPDFTDRWKPSTWRKSWLLK